MKRARGQRGSGLVELLVVLATVGLITSTTVPTMFQVVQGSAVGNSRLTAIASIQHATYHICRDAQGAQSTDLVDGAASVDLLTLSWNDEGTEHTISYSISSSELQRTYDGDALSVGQDVSSIEFSRVGRTLKVTITSTPHPKVSKSSTYYIHLRPAEQ